MASKDMMDKKETWPKRLNSCSYVVSA